MKRTLSATLGFAAFMVGLAACSTAMTSMQYGESLYNKGRYVEAADAFTDAITLDPRSAAAWSNRAVARVRMGQTTAAIADYNKALALTPLDAELYYNRGNALVAAGQYQEAIADYSRALDLNPNYAKAMFNRGTAYSMLGQRDVAQTEWVRAVELEPDPWTKAAMRRSAGLDAPAIVKLVPADTPQPIVAPAPPPGTGPATVPVPDASPVAAKPPVPPAAHPQGLVAPPPPPQIAVAPAPPPPPPAASIQALDARALASRAITRELDGDHAGAMQDLKSALMLEPDPARRASIANLIRLLDRPR